jgi:superfamily II DNA/RNA helicase
MAEGVDLHQDCRYVIHHDLDWNPSTLEQRTGRIDRIGSKAEATGQPVVIYEPYLGGTHDEKMFRVVKDRERWFGIVMGDAPSSDERATEEQEERVPLPAALAKQLTMDLALTGGDGSEASIGAVR